MARFRFYTVVTVSGAVIMALEILASRVLAPEFGNSVYVWGSIISIFLAALSAGYVMGGGLADRWPELSILGRLVLAAAATLWILLLVGQRLTTLLGNLTGGSSWGTLIAAGLIFGPPSLLLATVSPFAIRLAARNLEHLGNTAGRLFALSTAGSLAGTLCCTFVLIPHLELNRIFAILMLATTLTGGIALVGDWRSNRASVLAATGLVLISLMYLFSAPRVEEGFLHTRITPYQTLQVSEIGGTRYLRSNGVLQSAVRLADGEPGLHYHRYASGALLLRPEVGRMLVLGMGGGDVGRYLGSRLPSLRVEYVELDAAVPEIAKRFMFFDEGEGDNVHVADGRRFLAVSEERWDYIYVDTYVGHSVPFHLTTTEFLTIVKAHLEPDGVLGVNLAAGPDHPFVQAVVKTIAGRFGNVFVFPVRGAGNLLILATDLDVAPTRSALIERGRILDESAEFSPSLAEIASSRLEEGVDLTAVSPLTDAFAPADHLVSLGKRNWRSQPPAER